MRLDERKEHFGPAWVRFELESGCVAASNSGHHSGAHGLCADAPRVRAGARLQPLTPQQILDLDTCARRIQARWRGKHLRSMVCHSHTQKHPHALSLSYPCAHALSHTFGYRCTSTPRPLSARTARAARRTTAAAPKMRRRDGRQVVRPAAPQMGRDGAAPHGTAGWGSRYSSSGRRRPRHCWHVAGR